MAGFQHIQPRHLHIQVALFNDKRVAGGQRLDLRIAEGGFIHIIRHTDGSLAGHDLSDKLLLVLHKLVEVSVKSAFRYIPIDFHLLVFVALADNTAQPLLKVGRPPGAVQVMQGNELILDVGARAHFGRGTQQHPHLPGAHFGKQLLLFSLAVRCVDKCDFFLRDTGVHQFLFQIIVNAERTVSGWRGQVAEYKLGRAFFFGLFPDAEHIPGADSYFAVRVVRGQRLDEPHIQCQFPPVVGNAQHIVHMGVNPSGVDLLGPFRQPLYHLFLNLGRFNDFRVEVGLWYGESQHIRRLDVRRPFESGHQFRQVIKLGEPGFDPVAGALRR